jgi:hypothetical protein
VTFAKSDHDALYHRFFSDPEVVAQSLGALLPG